MSEQEREEPGLEEASEDKEEVKEGKKVPYRKYAALLEKLEKAEADVDHWKNEYYRVYADTQNLRRQLEEDSRRAIRYRAEGFLTELLPALDAFHMALVNPAPTKEAANYQIGFSYIYNQIVGALVSEGVSELSPKLGDDFDPASMHAVDTVEPSEEIPEGKVAKVHAKGYRLHDRLIRPAMVSVAKKPIEKEEPKEEEEEEQTSTPAQA